MCATYPAHLTLLDFITRTILIQEYRSLSPSLCLSFRLGKHIMRQKVAFVGVITCERWLSSHWDDIRGIRYCALAVTLETWTREEIRKFAVLFGIYGPNMLPPSKTLLILRTLYCDGVVRVHLSENGAENFKMSEPTYMVVIAPVGPTRQGWLWTQHEWCNWFWKTKLVILRDMPVAYSLL